VILSNVEVHKALDQRRLVITPEPLPRFPSVGGEHCPYDTHSIDLRLGDEISVPRPGSYAYDHTQTASLTEHISRNSIAYRISQQTPFKLERGQFALGITHELVDLPLLDEYETCLAARIEGKSSRARTGLLIHFTAPTVHPGFRGRLVLEMCNLGACPILLTPMMYIAQLIVEEVKGIPRRNDSQFQGQMTSAGTAERMKNSEITVDPRIDGSQS
jgi:dCTP deaminase